MAKKNAGVVVHHQENQMASAEMFIQQAIQSNAPIETMERLYALYEREKDARAKAAFVQALSQFQGECPVIKKTKKVMNKDGRTLRYMYAPMDSVIEQIKKPLANNGLSYSWNVEHKNNHMIVTCKLTHSMGHAETSVFEVPIVASEYMNSPQSYATAQSYAKRYTLLNILGIGTADEDTDATTVGNQKDPISPKSKIMFLLKSLGQNVNVAGKPDTAKTEAAVIALTKLDLVEKNYGEIVERLEKQLKEKNQDDSKEIR